MVSENGRITIKTADPTRALHAVTGWAIDRDIELSDLTVTRPSLEDIYLQLTEDPADG